MAYVLVCDLCGKPLTSEESSEHYKIKKLRFSWHESWWETIDIHKQCREKLFGLVKDYDSEGTVET